MKKTTTRSTVATRKVAPAVPARKSSRKAPPSMDGILATKVLTLAHVLGRSATLMYRDLLGLPLTSFRLVSLLGGRPPMMLNELALFSGIDKSQLSRAISDLVAQEIVTRRTSEDDSRAVQIELAPRGLELYATLSKHARKRNERLMDGLSETKRTQLLTMLEQVTVLAREMLAEQEADARADR